MVMPTAFARLPLLPEYLVHAIQEKYAVGRFLGMSSSDDFNSWIVLDFIFNVNDVLHHGVCGRD